MFFNRKKKEDKFIANDDRIKVDTTTITTMVGVDTLIEGTLKTKSSIRINGTIIGDVRADGIVVLTKTGKIVGTIEAESIIVAGVVEGNMSIRDKVNVEATGEIYGDVITKKFVIDEESIFQGNCIMNRDGKVIPVPPYIKDSEKKAEEDKSEDKKENVDDEIIKDDDGNPTYDKTWVSSVDVSVPKYMLGGTDGAFDTITSDEQLETIKADLLKKFFNCLIDTPRIANVLKCDAGITYDACYTPDIKRAMTKLLQNRRDICVVFDTMMAENLEEAVAIAKDIQSWIDPLDGGENYAIVPHCGITVDRAVNVRVTGTYEFAYGLTRLYRLAPFSIYAGKQNDYGCVRKTIFDWVIEESIPKGYQQKLAKKNKLYWATDLGKAVSSYAVGNDTERNVYFYSNASLYGESGSKLAEFRNGILCNDIRRMCKLILVKYTFDSDGAEAAIEKAKQEIFRVFKNRYPSNIVITYDLYQTDRDKKINEASCDINVVFPDVFETWNVKIVAGRNE